VFELEKERERYVGNQQSPLGDVSQQRRGVNGAEFKKSTNKCEDDDRKRVTDDYNGDGIVE